MENHKHKWRRGVKSFPVRGGESQTYQYVCRCGEERYVEPAESAEILVAGPAPERKYDRDGNRIDTLVSTLGTQNKKWREEK